MLIVECAAAILIVSYSKKKKKERGIGDVRWKNEQRWFNAGEQKKDCCLSKSHVSLGREGVLGGN